MLTLSYKSFYNKTAIFLFYVGIHILLCNFTKIPHLFLDFLHSFIHQIIVVHTQSQLTHCPVALHPGTSEPQILAPILASWRMERNGEVQQRLFFTFLHGNKTMEAI
jgi:hypothetical protein